MPTVANELVLETKLYKHKSRRAVILADQEISADALAKMNSWQKDTPLGGARFRWEKSGIYSQDYDDNGYI